MRPRGIGGPFGFKEGVCHAPQAVLHRDAAEKDEALSAVQLAADIGAVEEVYKQRPRLVHCAELHHLHAAADAHKLRLLGYHGAHADALAVFEGGDGLEAAPVLIGAREV